jgi:hypothetical protein
MAFAPNYPHTGSQISGDSTGKNRTRSSVSTNIIIQVNGSPVGAIQKLDYAETRAVKFIDELGTDGHVDSCPEKAVQVAGNCTRIKFDNMGIAAAFSRGFVHVSAQRIPFDIHIIDVFASDENDAAGFEDGNGTVVTVLKKVWIKSITNAFSSTDFVISQSMTFEAETVFSIMSNNGTAVTAVGARVLANTQFDQFEIQADTGQRRGALDAAGLINAVANM